jgi:uncharacterized DUF497 family protein
MSNSTARHMHIKLLACVAAFAALFAFGSFAAHAADLSQTKETMQKLAEIKDDTSLSPQEKETMEISLRKDILLAIVDVSRKQSQELKDRIGSIAFPQSEDWDRIKARLLDDINSSLTFYDATQAQLEDKNLSLNDIKDISLKLETRKSAQFDAATEQASITVSALNIGDILKLADERLAKISTDVDKVYGQKIVKNPSLRGMLDRSARALQESHRLDDKSKDVILGIYGGNESKEAAEYRQGIENEIRAIKVRSMSKEEKAAYDRSRKQLEVSDEDVRRYVQTLLNSSVDGIRSAYDTFLKMSVNVRDYLK